MGDETKQSNPVSFDYEVLVDCSTLREIANKSFAQLQDVKAESNNHINLRVTGQVKKLY